MRKNKTATQYPHSLKAANELQIFLQSSNFISQCQSVTKSQKWCLEYGETAALSTHNTTYYLTDGSPRRVGVRSGIFALTTCRPLVSVWTWRLAKLCFLNEVQHPKCFVWLNRHRNKRNIIKMKYYQFCSNCSVGKQQNHHPWMNRYWFSTRYQMWIPVS